MEDVRLGALLRAVRLRRGLRQVDVAAAAGVGHATISLVERGHLSSLSLRTLRRICEPLEITLDVAGRWRGGDAERLISRRHSLLADSFAKSMADRPGWLGEPEVSFSIYGERGVIDRLCWHPGRAHLAVFEFKTELVDLNQMLGALGRYARFAPAIAADRGWKPRHVSVWLILSDNRTNRRHAADHRALLANRFQRDGRQLQAFLRDPKEACWGLAFWPHSRGGSGSHEPARKRVRIRGATPGAGAPMGAGARQMDAAGPLSGPVDARGRPTL